MSAHSRADEHVTGYILREFPHEQYDRFGDEVDPDDPEARIRLALENGMCAEEILGHMVDIVAEIIKEIVAEIIKEEAGEE